MKNRCLLRYSASYFNIVLNILNLNLTAYIRCLLSYNYRPIRSQHSKHIQSIHLLTCNKVCDLIVDYFIVVNLFRMIFNRKWICFAIPALHKVYSYPCVRIVEVVINSCIVDVIVERLVIVKVHEVTFHFLRLLFAVHIIHVVHNVINTS